MFYFVCIQSSLSKIKIKNHIYLKKKCMTWFRFNIFIYQKLKNNIFTCIFRFNNQFIESIRTWIIYQKHQKNILFTDWYMNLNGQNLNNAHGLNSSLTTLNNHLADK